MRSLRSIVSVALLAAVAACVDGEPVTSFEDPAESIRLAVVGARAASPEETIALAEAFDQVDQYSVMISYTQTLEPIVDTTVVITPGASTHRLDITVPEEAFGRTVTVDLIAYANGLELYRSTLTLVLEEEISRLPVELEIRYTGPGIRGQIRDANGVGVENVPVDVVMNDETIASTVTEDDGTYVFLEVPVGESMTVIPSPAEPFLVCPGFRQITLGTASDAVVADFNVTEETCEIEVLVLSGGDFDDTDDVATLLATNPNLTVLDPFFYVNQLPTAAQLDAADVVLLFANGLFDESVALGDRLAAYVGRGGNVVTASFYWQNRSDSGLGSPGWGALEQLDALVSNGGANYTSATLGTVVPHPLTTGLGALVTTTFWGGGALNAGATAVATWDDDSPLIAHRTLAGGQRMVGVSLFPAVGTAAAGDVAIVFQNAVEWAGSAGGPAQN